MVEKFVTKPDLLSNQHLGARISSTPQQSNNQEPDTPLEGKELGTLWNQYGHKLKLYARQWCRDADDDVVQEAFIKLACESPRPADPAAWMFTTVKNMAINASKNRSSRQKYENIVASEAPVLFEENKSAAIDVADMIGALGSLDLAHREIIVLRLWSELTFEQIEEITGTSSSSAQRNYMAAIAELKKRMEK